MPTVAELAAKSIGTPNPASSGLAGALKLSALSAVVALSATGASAQVYGDTPGCAWLAGENPQTDSLYLYDGATIQRSESTCPVTGSQQVGTGAILLTVQCTGEGETWENYYMLMTTADPDRYIIRPSDLDDSANTEITVCVPE